MYVYEDTALSFLVDHVLKSCYAYISNQFKEISCYSDLKRNN